MRQNFVYYHHNVVQSSSLRQNLLVWLFSAQPIASEPTRLPRSGARDTKIRRFRETHRDDVWVIFDPCDSDFSWARRAYSHVIELFVRRSKAQQCGRGRILPVCDEINAR